MTSRADKKEKKLAVLEEIKNKKQILFGAFSQKLTKSDKEKAWREVLMKGQSFQLVGMDKSWTYMRDNVFGLWKSRTLAKRDNAKKTGATGGKANILDEIDKAILDILEPNSPIVCGLSLPESSGNSLDSTDNFSESPEKDHQSNPKPKKRAATGKQPDVTEEKRLRLDLLSIEIYHRKLQCLKLERELRLPPSEITKNIRNEVETTTEESCESLIEKTLDFDSY